jgi:hypothetical protein
MHHILPTNTKVKMMAAHHIVHMRSVAMFLLPC